VTRGIVRSIMNNHIFARDLDSFLLNKLQRRKNVHETDSAQQLHTYAVADHVHNLGSILRGIDVNTERTLSKRSIHNFHDCFPNRSGIGVRRNNRGKALHHIICKTFVRSVVILSDTLSIGRPARVSEMVCSSCELTGNDDGGLDAPAGEFTSGHDRQSIHPGLRCKIRCEVGRSTNGRAAARYPDHQSLLLLPQLGQSGPIDALRAQDVHVIEFRELFRGERLDRAEHHMARVVDHHIQTTVVFDDLRYRRIRRRIR